MMYPADISKSVERRWPPTGAGSPLTEVSLPPAFFFTYPVGPWGIRVHSPQSVLGTLSECQGQAGWEKNG